MERRVAVRHQMIKSAQLVFGGATLTCAALDLSVTGARLSLFAPADIPEKVILRLPNGEVRVARRRWQQGNELGFEFYGQREAFSCVL